MEINSIKDLQTVDDVYYYLRRLIIEVPQSYDLAHEIASLNKNKNFNSWAEQDQKFIEMIDFASHLEVNPNDLMSWVRLKTLIV